MADIRPSLDISRTAAEDFAFRRPPTARFQGSFVGEHPVKPTLLEDHVPSRRKTGILARLAPLGKGWIYVGIWQSAFIEMIATGLLCYLSGLIDTTIMKFNVNQGAAYTGVTNVFLLTLFIMAAGPGSGGHVNPTITFATMVTGLSALSRGVLYLAAQTVGAAFAGGALRGSFGGKTAANQYHGGGCYRPSTMAIGQVLVIEIVSTFAMVFLAFGVGLDPRQQKLFGMFMGPLAVGCAVGLTSFASAGFFAGYTGASMHPARCFAFAIARGRFEDQWIWWVGPIAGTLLFGIVYHIAPYQNPSATSHEEYAVVEIGQGSGP